MSKKVIELLYASGREFYDLCVLFGPEGDRLVNNDILIRIEQLIATEASKDGSNVLLIPSDSAMREFYRSIGLKSAIELSQLRSSQEFVLAHIGIVKANIGRGKFGGALAGIVGGYFKSEDLGVTRSEVGFKLKKKGQTNCDEMQGLLKWVVKSKNEVKHIGSANRIDTMYADPEYDIYQVDSGKLDCADFYRIPITLETEQIRLRLLEEKRPSQQRKRKF